MITRMNWLKCIGACSFHGKLGFSHECRWGERQPVCLGWVVPSALQFLLYHVHTWLFNPGFLPLIVYKPLFLFECRYNKEHCCCSRFMSILNCPQSTQSHSEDDWWQLLISWKHSQFYPQSSPAALLPNFNESSCCPQAPSGACIDCARSPDPNICFQEFWYIGLNILAAWLVSVRPL